MSARAPRGGAAAFRPFDRLEAQVFDDALAQGDDVERAAHRAGRSPLDGYRQFHRICARLGEPAREG